MDPRNKRLTENGFEAVSFSKGPGSTSSIPTEMPAPSETKTDWLESWLTSLEITFRGGVTEDPDDFQKRLLNSPKPSYPALAQRAGLQGIVRLQVRVKKDGSVGVQKLLEGEPALADAAIAAVKQWRGETPPHQRNPGEAIFSAEFIFSYSFAARHSP